MRYYILFTTLWLSILIAMGNGIYPPVLAQTATPLRSVAITFDDLPAAGMAYDVATLRDLTTRLLSTIKQHEIPTIGFVNEGRLYYMGNYQKRTKILKQWVNNGIELGNHTFSHFSFYDLSLADFEQDVIWGERTAKRLMKHKGMSLRYFRYPYLNTGRDAITKMSFEAFLAARGYRVAPATITSYEWMMAEAYAEAKILGDSDACGRIGTDYIVYMDTVFAFYEQFSRDLFGREIAQVAIFHANMLNADYFEQIVQMMLARGYRFITLDEALQDPAYTLPDNYYGAIGMSWMQRWSYTLGKGLRKEPLPPNFSLQYFLQTSD